MERIKIELDFIPVEEKLPVDDWRKEPWYNEDTRIIGTFFGIVDNDEINDDPEIIMVDYWPDKGFVYRTDSKTEYDGNPWRITHWAEIPILKSKEQQRITVIMNKLIKGYDQKTGKTEKEKA